MLTIKSCFSKGNAVVKKAFMPALFMGTFLILYMMGAHAEDAMQAEAEKAFHQADAINDGRIDPGEFDMYHLRAFKALDKSGDGILSLDECAGSCFKPKTGSNEAAPSGTLHYKFEAIDADGSGQIAEYEYILYAREHFQDFDTTHDGVIDKDEFCAFYKESMPCTFSAAIDKM
jgi:Ca2+-binding EF-hand superfamily protein